MLLNSQKMKKILCSIIAIAGIYLFSACNNGDYVANPTTNSNNSANPLSFLQADQFSWNGTDALSAKIDGSFFNSDTLHTSWFLDTAGFDNIVGVTSTFHGFALRFKGVYAGNLYPFGTLTNFNSTRICTYFDSVDRPRVYTSAAGNVGELYLIQNDDFTGPLARIKGKFYFQAVDTSGKIVNVTEGWFNIKKFP